MTMQPQWSNGFSPDGQQCFIMAVPVPMQNMQMVQNIMQNMQMVPQNWEKANGDQIPVQMHEQSPNPQQQAITSPTKHQSFDMLFGNGEQQHQQKQMPQQHHSLQQLLQQQQQVPQHTNKQRCRRNKPEQQYLSTAEQHYQNAKAAQQQYPNNGEQDAVWYKAEQDHTWHLEHGFPYYMSSAMPDNGPVPRTADMRQQEITPPRGGAPNEKSNRSQRKQGKASPHQGKDKKNAQRYPLATEMCADTICTSDATRMMPKKKDSRNEATLPTPKARDSRHEASDGMKEGTCSDMALQDAVSRKDRQGKGKDAGSPEQDNRAVTMKEQLSALRLEDPAKVLVARRINKLGFASADMLWEHFAKYGEVKDVHVSHSHVKSFISTGHRRYGISEHQRLRAAGLGFIIMESAEVAQKILAEGSDHVVKGVSVQILKFQCTAEADEESPTTTTIDSLPTATTIDSLPMWNQQPSNSDHNDEPLEVAPKAIMQGSRQRYPSPGSSDYD